MTIRSLDHVHFLTNDTNKTIDFYTKIIGLHLGNSMSIDTASTLYFYIPGGNIPILHIGQASITPDPTKFERLAKVNNNSAKFSTGNFDHFCLLLDLNNYEDYIKNLKHNNIEYKTYIHPNAQLKQIWILDPNGVRVELNFTN